MDNIRLSLLENNFIFYICEMVRVNTARHISYKPPKNFSTFDPSRKTFPKNDIEKLAAALYLPKNVIKGCSKDSNY